MKENNEKKRKEEGIKEWKKEELNEKKWKDIEKKI